MSIIYNGKSVAGKYNISSVTNASDISAGIIKIATEDELLDSFNNETAITPHLLNEVSKKNSFNNSRITNCVTEIPQDIKLELKDGEIIAKAGSKIYTPNGVGVFGEKILETDLKYTVDTSKSGQWFVGVRDDNVGLFLGAIANSTSGTTETAKAYSFFYNTSTNTITRYNGSSVAESCRSSLPIGIVTMGANGAISIDQVFNGFGYIGSTAFALPNIKGLIPNGRNEDGTLNNIELISKRVVTRHITWSCEKGQKVSLRINDTGLDSTTSVAYYYQQEQEPNIQHHAYWYKPSVNKMYRRSGTESWYEFNAVVIGEWYNTGENTNISAFNTAQPLRAVDYNEFNSTPHIIETYRNGTSWYKVYSDGWCEQGGRASWGSAITDMVRLQVTLLKPYADKNYSVFEMPIRTDRDGETNGLCAAMLGVFDLQTTSFCLRAYCGNTNEKLNIMQWQTCGYIT